MPPSSTPRAELSGRVVFSASEDGYGAAVHELRQAFGRLDVDRAGPDLGLLPADGPSVRDVREACFTRPMAYVRHLTELHDQVHRDDAGELEPVAQAALQVVLKSAPKGTLAVQAWSSGAPRMPYTAGELATRITHLLADEGIAAERAGADVVLSCCITAKGVLIGLNSARNSLSDWPGGRARLGKPKEQVSRAEFKLEELFGLFPLDLPPRGRAIDLGAAPGGWTRILRQRGLEVWAIDPGDMAPALLADRLVHHERTTAGEFFRASDLLFDVAVNDMRMDPELSCSIMADAAHRLKPGAYAIVTLKTGTHRPVETLQRCLTVLRRQYDIVFARQLHHNRHELTVVGRRSNKPRTERPRRARS